MRLRCFIGLLLWITSVAAVAHVCKDDWDDLIRHDGYVSVESGIEVNRVEGIREVQEGLCNAQGYFNADLKCPSLIWHPGSDPTYWQCSSAMVDWDGENETMSSLE